MSPEHIEQIKSEIQHEHDYWRSQAEIEKGLGGNVVKEAQYSGRAAGLQIALQILEAKRL